ncbi:hypothetical protein A2U01_0097101, partial [Trifolium medium]|nr:hypothetical protein [Trifolium medium]
MVEVQMMVEIQMMVEQSHVRMFVQLE